MPDAVHSVPPDDPCYIDPLPENPRLVRVRMKFGNEIEGGLIVLKEGHAMLLIDGHRFWTYQIQFVTYL